MKVINGLKLWHLQALGAAVLMIGVSACSGVALTRGAQHPGLGDDWQLVTVNSGSIVKEVPISGRLVFPRTAELTFGVGGEVGEILVQPGQQVTQGQILARLDAITWAELTRVVAAERVSLDQSQKRLDDFHRSYTQQLAAARQARARADVTLDQAQELLADFQQDYQQQLARAIQARADAEFALDQAQQQLDDFQQDYQQELAQAQQAKADAEVALDQARNNLAGFYRQFQQNLAQAQQAKADAEVALDTARDRLNDFQLDYEQRLAQARQARGDAEVALRQAEDALSEFIINPTRDPREPDELFDVRELQRLQATVELGRANLQKAQEEEARLVAGPNHMERQEVEAAAELAQANLRVAEKALADITRTATPQDIALRETKIAAAEAQLRAAQEELGRLTSGGAAPQEVARQEASVDAARAALAAAQDNLAAIMAGADPLALQQLETAVEEARTNLVRRDSDLKRLEDGPDSLKLQQRQAAVDLAQTVLAGAGRDLARLQDGPNPLKLALLERDVSLAQESVAAANRELADLADGPNAFELALREAEVSLAQSALDQATENLEGALLRAPFDGVVSLVNAAVDDRVSKMSRVMAVVDPSVVAVVGSVDATDVRSVGAGDRATVTVESLPGQLLEGTVASIATQPRTERGVVSYPVTIQISLPDGVTIPVRLTAVSGTVIHEGERALLVPRGAVRGTARHPAVLVMNNGTVEERAVVLGESDGYWVEVTQGLNQGEQVAVDRASLPPDNAPTIFHTDSASSR